MRSRSRRKSPRLQGYDYGQSGAYFVTLCTRDMAHLFGRVVDDAMVLNAWGQIVQEEWERTAVVRPDVALDVYVVMPNHMHGIVYLAGASSDVGASRRLARTHTPDAITSQAHEPASRLAPRSLGAIIAQFKSIVTKRIRSLPDVDYDIAIWQRSYHDHIIRNAADLDRIREYIVNNPARWQADRFYGEG